LSRPRLLIVYPDAYDRESFAGLDGFDVLFFDDAPSHWRPDPAFDPVDYLDRCLAFARREKVDAVLSTHDLGDLIAAIVARELGLRGPSPESVFLCLHKYYGRQREAEPVRCTALALDEPPPPLEYPAYFKPPWLKLGLLGFKLENDGDLARALEVARREYPAWARQYAPLFARAVDLRDYPLAAENVMLVEEFVEGPQVTVEGWVRGGRANIWAITDTNTFPGTRAIDNFSLPSRHDGETLEAMARYAEDAIARMGFDDGFFNLELWKTADGPRLTEINGRAAVCFAGLHNAALGADIFAAVADVACGDDPRAVPHGAGAVAGQFNVLAFEEGRAGDLVDFDAAANIPELALYHDRDTLIRPASEFGAVLGQIELSGPSYEAIHQKAEEIRRQVKYPE
jgi:ATP-grasp domain